MAIDNEVVALVLQASSCLVGNFTLAGQEIPREAVMAARPPTESLQLEEKTVSIYSLSGA
jgi:hypothetical protein